MAVTYHQFDCVIVGAGGGGLRAALESSKRASTAVVTKLYPTRSHTGAAQGGMCAALANVEEDSWEWHTFDTVKGGDYLVDQDAAEIMCREAIDAVIELEHMGLPFNRTPDGRIDQRRFGGHTRNHGEAPVRRACYAADRTGHMILQTLFQQCVRNHVQFFNEWFVLDLILTDDNRCAGVVAYELKTGELHVLHAKSVLFATGGFGKFFRITSNAHTLTGDGPGMCLRRGIPLEDMEFFQFHPTGIYGLGILLSEAARGEGAILLNGEGERFMERYAPTIKDLAPRDMVSRAIYQEIAEGRGVGGKDFVHLDVRHLSREVLETKLPDITEFARLYLGVEPTTELVPIQPTAHYAMGGIPTDVGAQVVVDEANSPLPGLYAAGECACVSVHGANRLGTNSLLDIIVFGRRGGIQMAEHAAESELPPLPEDPAAGARDLLAGLLKRSVGGEGDERIAPLRKRLQDEMMADCGVVRTDESLGRVLGTIAELRERYGRAGVEDKGSAYNTELLEAVEMGFLLDLAEVTAVAARARTESRGGHYREDFPLRDDGYWMRHSLARRREDGTIELNYKPVTVTRYMPMERKY
ncbi:MAG: succinate dehydrogenase or fumarate reductase, flavoprotein subunit [Actinobacteria bacterium]|jgi:succinate dehydrogenase / fumarate reductase flavoprotein subunit|nr:succinate dehydrogenase or fumarate reductase, flavoprotein subunit [Actinomycetota bacterium]MEA2591412.1 succinate dehydrogenase / fumarate reductase, flavoprotein subunit [Actinomycetota bacterium]